MNLLIFLSKEEQTAVFLFFCIKQHLFVYRATLKGKLMYQYKFSQYLPLKLFQTRMLSWFVFILFVLCSIQNEKFG